MNFFISYFRGTLLYQVISRGCCITVSTLLVLLLPDFLLLVDFLVDRGVPVLLVDFLVD